jgi:hypothetical protein
MSKTYQRPEYNEALQYCDASQTTSVAPVEYVQENGNAAAQQAMADAQAREAAQESARKAEMNEKRSLCGQKAGEFNEETGSCKPLSERWGPGEKGSAQRTMYRTLRKREGCIDRGGKPFISNERQACRFGPPRPNYDGPTISAGKPGDHLRTRPRDRMKGARDAATLPGAIRWILHGTGVTDQDKTHQQVEDEAAVAAQAGRIVEAGAPMKVPNRPKHSPTSASGPAPKNGAEVRRRK